MSWLCFADSSGRFADGLQSTGCSTPSSPQTQQPPETPLAVTQVPFAITACAETHECQRKLGRGKHAPETRTSVRMEGEHSCIPGLFFTPKAGKMLPALVHHVSAQGKVSLMYPARGASMTE